MKQNHYFFPILITSSMPQKDETTTTQKKNTKKTRRRRHVQYEKRVTYNMGFSRESRCSRESEIPGIATRNSSHDTKNNFDFDRKLQLTGVHSTLYRSVYTYDISSHEPSYVFDLRLFPLIETREIDEILLLKNLQRRERAQN